MYRPRLLSYYRDLKADQLPIFTLSIRSAKHSITIGGIIYLMKKLSQVFVNTERRQVSLERGKNRLKKMIGGLTVELKKS